jgi:hypothetical protein
MPWTSAITGWGMRWIICIITAQRLKRSRNAAAPPSLAWRLVVISLRSWPAQNALPAPRSTITRDVSEVCSARNADVSAASIASDRALRLPGEFIVR